MGERGFVKQKQNKTEHYNQAFQALNSIQSIMHFTHGDLLEVHDYVRSFRFALFRFVAFGGEVCDHQSGWK